MFGNGHLKEGGYVFDSITCLPPSFSGKKMSASKLQSVLSSHEEILVVFDPSPKCEMFRHQLLRNLKIDEDAMGVKTSPENILPIISDPDCDFYITSTSGQLLAVGCHEDTWLGKERIMWCPVKDVC
jgi:hypothetical protein